MNNTLLDTVAACSKDLMKFGFSVEEFATLVQENNMTDAEVLAVAKVFEHLKAKKDSSTVDFLLRTSRLPLKVPKTFDNFDFSRITGKNIDKLRNLSTLSALYAHKNLAFIGKPGTGKTHLAQAFGRACCEHGMKAYFIKMTELRDRMTDARRAGRESTLLAALVRPSCLIIDEVGHCEFDKENTRLFFDMVDRRYQKDGYYNMVLPATVILHSGRRISVRMTRSCVRLTASSMMRLCFRLRARASAAAALRRFPCGHPQRLRPLPPAKRAAFKPTSKPGLATPSRHGLAISARLKLAVFSRLKMAIFSRR